MSDQANAVEGQEHTLYEVRSGAAWITLNPTQGAQRTVEHSGE